MYENNKFWWSDVTENYKIRDLTLADLDQIHLLIKEKPELWKSTRLDQNDVDMYTGLYEKKLKDSRFRCIGAFFNEKLVMENSAFYPIKANHWYHISLRHSNENASLFSGNLQRYLFADCFIPLIEYGEQLKKFSFYAMRSVPHQRVINRMWRRTKPPSPLAKYDFYIDGCILANTENENFLYEIFFPKNKVYSIDLVVYLHCLKQEYREEILKDSSII